MAWEDYLEDDLTPEVISDLKATYGPLFKTDIEGTAYVFRTLTRADAVSLGLVDGEMTPEMEEEVFVATKVWPKGEVDFDTMRAGTPTAIVEEIMKRSGIYGHEWLNTYLQRSRNNQTAYHTIAATICSALPILPGELDTLNIQQLTDLLVQAEEILAIKAHVNRGSYVPLYFESQEEDRPATELSDEEKDAMVRAMLEGSMGDIPNGVVDRSKVPPGGIPFMPDDDV